MEEEGVLQKLPSRIKLGTCDHVPSDHLSALSSIQKSIGELDNSRAN